MPEVIPAWGYLIKYISSHPIPFIPFPSRGRELGYLREASPLFDPLSKKRGKVSEEGLRPS
jgi:hypothetical protein